MSRMAPGDYVQTRTHGMWLPGYTVVSVSEDSARVTVERHGIESTHDYCDVKPVLKMMKIDGEWVWR